VTISNKVGFDFKVSKVAVYNSAGQQFGISHHYVYKLQTIIIASFIIPFACLHMHEMKMIKKKSLKNAANSGDRP